MAIGDVLRLTRTVLVDGQTCVNVLHFLDVPGTSQNPEEALIDAWDPVDGSLTRPSPEDTYQVCQRGFTTYTQVSLSAQRIFPTEGEVFSRGFSLAKSAATDSGLPTFAQFKVLLNTDLISRSGRGGFYVPAIAESQTEGNVLNGATILSSIGTFLDAIEAVHTADGAEFSGFAIGVFSRLLSEFNAASVIGFSTTLGTMVSRRAGRGV